MMALDSARVRLPFQVDEFPEAACDSACSSSDIMKTTSSIFSNAAYGNGDCAHWHEEVSSSGLSWSQLLAAAQPCGHISEQRGLNCEAAIFFTNRVGAADAVGCPCNVCVKHVATKPDVPSSQQTWRYQQHEKRADKTQVCYQPVFVRASPGRFRGALDTAYSPGNPASSVSPSDETLRTLLHRAQQGFTATTAAAAAPKGSAGGQVAVPGPAKPALRRTAPGGVIRELDYAVSAAATWRRSEARSTPPIPVPSPPGAPQRQRQPLHAAAHSVEGGRCGRGDDDDDDEFVRVGELQHDEMLQAIKRFYEGLRRERARRPPGKPWEPLRVVIGFEPEREVAWGEKGDL